MHSVSRSGGEAVRRPYSVDLTREQMDKLRETVDYYDREWMDDGISTRSAELYTEPYERFHAMARALEAAYSDCDKNPSDSVFRDAVWELSDGFVGEIVIARSAEGFTIDCGYAAWRLLRNTVYEASRGPGPDPVICGMVEKF